VSVPVVYRCVCVPVMYRCECTCGVQVCVSVPVVYVGRCEVLVARVRTRVD